MTTPPDPDDFDETEDNDVTEEPGDFTVIAISFSTSDHEPRYRWPTGSFAEALRIHGGGHEGGDNDDNDDDELDDGAVEDFIEVSDESPKDRLENVTVGHMNESRVLALRWLLILLSSIIGLTGAGAIIGAVVNDGDIWANLKEWWTAVGPLVGGLTGAAVTFYFTDKQK